MRIVLFFLLLLHGYVVVQAQTPLRGLGNRIPRGGGGGGGMDSLQRRDKKEDSVNIFYRYLDSVQQFRLDTAVNDFRTRFPVPVTYQYLGNPGQPARSMLLQPESRGGFDAGFHIYDVYRWTPERARFFNTTKPFTELGYLLGSQTQQTIQVLQTQNIKPYWNLTFQYRLISGPGFFNNQRVNHNNLMLTSWYAARRKRYNNYFVITSNKMQSGENGGILNDTNYLDDPVYENRITIPTKLAPNTGFSRNFFTAPINTGRLHRDVTVLLRQQYDFGKKDSIVTDSTVIPLFYPRLRFEHTFRYGTQQYRFYDRSATDSFYWAAYSYLLLQSPDTIEVQDRWREVTNEFSIYQFPDAKNLQQYIKTGAGYQFLSGRVRTGTENLYNIYVQGEYRNLSRNKKWDITAQGQLWLAGYNSGDYRAYASLQRVLSSKLGSLQAGFENINRSPGFVFDNRSSFYVAAPQNFGKENWTRFFGHITNPALRLRLGAEYALVTNYLYFTGWKDPRQESTAFTLLRITGSKVFRLARRFNLHTDVWLQQPTGNPPVNVPQVLTRNRLMYEGTLGFRHLRLAAGVEARYHTAYNADGYSPLLGQFVFQDSIRIANRPDVDAFVHFRIRRFTTYFRLENLNTASSQNGFGFTRNNLAAPDYPYPGLVIRFGVFWGFIN